MECWWSSFRFFGIRGSMYGFVLCAVFFGGAFLGLPRHLCNAEGIVPCTRNIEVDTSKPDEICYLYECNVCDLQRLAMRILSFLILTGAIIAALLFVNAGALYVFSSASPANVSKAHSLFTSTLIGFVLVLAAYLLIDVAVKSLYGGPWGPWYEILCNGEQVRHCVDKLKPMTVKPDTIPSGMTCTQMGGTCIATGEATCTNPPEGSRIPPGSRIVPDTDCEKDKTYAEGVNKCCVPPGGGDSCKLPDGKDGTCKTAEVCGGTSQKGTCKDPFVCCKQRPAGADQCPSSNPYCSVDALVTAGFNEEQANIMSCIAMTESSGNPEKPPYNTTHPSSQSTACGLFAITKTLWNEFNGPQPFDPSCKNGGLNRGVALKVVQSRGYQPWTCDGCNASAQPCIDKYSNR